MTTDAGADYIVRLQQENGRLRRIEIAHNDLRGRIEALHYAAPPGRFGRLFCVNCDQYWPCETSTLLDPAPTE